MSRLAFFIFIYSLSFELLSYPGSLVFSNLVEFPIYSNLFPFHLSCQSFSEVLNVCYRSLPYIKNTLIILVITYHFKVFVPLFREFNVVFLYNVIIKEIIKQSPSCILGICLCSLYPDLFQLLNFICHKSRLDLFPSCINQLPFCECPISFLNVICQVKSF